MTEEAKGPKYDVNVEGTIHPWNEDKITPAQVRNLGNLPADQPVVEVNLETGEEKTLPEDAVIELQPGMAFARKVEFKRG
jgi:hypothetical protein